MFSLTASLCYELKEYAEKNKGSDKLYDMANNFFKFMMDNFETEMIVLGGRTALKVYKLHLSYERSYRGEFFKKYGKLIIEAHNQQSRHYWFKQREVLTSPFFVIINIS